MVDVSEKRQRAGSIKSLVCEITSVGSGMVDVGKKSKGWISEIMCVCPQVKPSNAMPTIQKADVKLERFCHCLFSHGNHLFPLHYSVLVLQSAS